MDELDRLLWDLRWLQASSDLRRRTWSLGPLARSAASGPLFCEVVIDWGDVHSEGLSEATGC